LALPGLEPRPLSRPARNESRVYFVTLSDSQITELLGQTIIDIHTELTDQLLYLIHVGGFLVVFPARGIWFSVQELPFFPTYFEAFFVRMLG
jgi:hypothetical protein